MKSGKPNGQAHSLNQLCMASTKLFFPQTRLSGLNRATAVSSYRGRALVREGVLSRKGPSHPPPRLALRAGLDAPSLLATMRPNREVQIPSQAPPASQGENLMNKLPLSLGKQLPQPKRPTGGPWRCHALSLTNLCFCLLFFAKSFGRSYKSHLLGASEGQTH